MFTAKVYKVMVGSLSGAIEDVFVAKETIRKWNIVNAERAGKLYMPIEWNTNVEMTTKVDVVFGIVGNWISDSSFIEVCVEEGKQVILFFNPFHDPMNTIPGEADAVEALKNKLSNYCSCVEYNGVPELIGLIDNHLNEY